MRSPEQLKTPSAADSLRDKIRRRGRIITLRCTDVLDASESLRQHFDSCKTLAPLWIDHPIGPGQLVAAWCGAGEEPDEPVARHLVQTARKVLDISVASESSIERAWELENSHGSAQLPGALTLARELIAADPASPAQSIRQCIAQMRANGLSFGEQFHRFCQLWADDVRPIAVVLNRHSAGMIETMRWVVSAIETSPEVGLFVLVDAAEWHALHPLLDPHCWALLRDGVLNWPTDSEHDDVDDADRAADLHSLRKRAKSAVRRAVQLADDPSAAEEVFAEARSLAEALLYRALEMDARTTGLFRLNAAGGFQFGPRPAEIDLFCSALKIAIEVDGYFHFQDKQAYRRDRSKDWLMQRQGHLVLRFLAEDVADDLELIVDRIADAVALKK